MSKTMVKLVREVRVGLHEEEGERVANGANGFAGNPVLRGMAPFVTVRATLEGEVDGATGMLINIKVVDRVIRERAVPQLRKAVYGGDGGGARAVRGVFGELRGAFAPHRLVEVALGASAYLSFACGAEDAEMVKVTQRFEFSAAHRLHSAALSDEENREVFGRCNNPNGHGHNYEVEVTVGGKVDDATGEVIGVETLQRIVNERVIDVYDHKHLNVDCAEFLELNPTVENIGAVIFGRLKEGMPEGVRLERVRVWETPKTYCEVSA